MRACTLNTIINTLRDYWEIVIMWVNKRGEEKEKDGGKKV